MPEAIKLYIRDIHNIPLLTAEEEIELARSIQKGDEEARQRMIRSNLRLVISIAKRYARYGVPMMDLIEEGNLGLIKAVSKFDPARGYRFSTYAAWWIKQYVTRAIANQGKTIRIPVYMTELIARWKKTQERLTQKFGRRPQPKEVAKAMGIPLKKVKQLSGLGKRTSSLDAPLGEDGTSQFIDVLVDEMAVSPVEEIAQFMRRERIERLLSQMDAREREILTLRFGLRDGETRTLGQTAKRFGITRERVRQIESAALIKMRAMIAREEEEAEGKLEDERARIRRGR